MSSGPAAGEASAWHPPRPTGADRPGDRASTNVRPVRWATRAPAEGHHLRPERQEFLWPITVHRLDGTTEDTSLVIPDPFAVRALQIDRVKQHLSGPSIWREGR